MKFKIITLLLSLIIMSTMLSCEDNGTMEQLNVQNDKYNIEKLYIDDGGTYVYIVSRKDTISDLNVIFPRSNGKTTRHETTLIEKSNVSPPKYQIVSEKDSIITLKRVN